MKPLCIFRNGPLATPACQTRQGRQVPPHILTEPQAGHAASLAALPALPGPCWPRTGGTQIVLVPDMPGYLTCSMMTKPASAPTRVGIYLRHLTEPSSNLAIWHFCKEYNTVAANRLLFLHLHHGLGKGLAGNNGHVGKQRRNRYIHEADCSQP